MSTLLTVILAVTSGACIAITAYTAGYVMSLLWFKKKLPQIFEDQIEEAFKDAKFVEEMEAMMMLKSIHGRHERNRTVN